VTTAIKLAAVTAGRSPEKDYCANREADDARAGTEESRGVGVKRGKKKKNGKAEEKRKRKVKERPCHSLGG
jgi:hypothetical protein